jgi:hypothetical protein
MVEGLKKLSMPAKVSPERASSSATDLFPPTH